MTWRWPAIRMRPALQLLAAFVAVGLVQGVLVRLIQHLRGVTPSGPTILFQLTGAIGAWAAVPVVQAMVLNAAPPFGRGKVPWLRLATFHLIGYAVFTGVHFAFLRGLRALLLELSIVNVSDGDLATRVLWEAQNDLIVYASVAGFFTVLQAWAERDRNAVRAALLETRLVEAKLVALSAQVDPHFFYNALNTVSAVMYEDLPKTERLLASLASIMRATLREGGTATWSLAEERAHTERYVELLLARFGERLHVEWAAAPGVERLSVPRFSLQTLVENAVKHNAARLEPLGIRVDLSRTAGVLQLAVEDDGVGFAATAGAGNGLERLEQTLSLLHGERARLERGAGASGGARVTLHLPAIAS